MIYSTPDAAIRAVFSTPSIGMDPGRVPGDRHQAEEAEFARGIIQGILAQLSPQEWAIVVASAHMLSYREIARKMHLSDRTVRRIHKPAWERIHRRLRDLGVVS